MGRAWMGLIMVLGCWAVAQTFVSTPAQAQLDPYFYSETCPSLFRIVAETMLDAIANDSRSAASLLRIHFHDCFVLGCDASVLLIGDASERTNLPNLGSLRSFDVIDNIKAALEAECPNVVSCADVVALASFFGVVLSGGPIWVIPLGRRDGLVPSALSDLVVNLPPSSSNITFLSSLFASKNLTLTDLVALSGGHTIGDSRCVSFDINVPINDDRLYNFSGTGLPDPDLNSTYGNFLRGVCPLGGDGNVTTGMDVRSNRTFDNAYFKNFLTGEQLFISDNALYNGNLSDADLTFTRQLVLDYAANQSLFFSDFTQSMIKMGNINVTTGTNGQIRTNCSVANPTSSDAPAPSPAAPAPSSGAPTPSSVAESAKISLELSDEEKDLFVDEVRRTVERVKYEYFGRHLDRLVEEGVDSSSHSSF